MYKKMIIINKVKDSNRMFYKRKKVVHFTLKNKNDSKRDKRELETNESKEELNIRIRFEKNMAKLFGCKI
jgi:hypothetical protein